MTAPTKAAGPAYSATSTSRPVSFSSIVSLLVAPRLAAAAPAGFEPAPGLSCPGNLPCVASPRAANPPGPHAAPSRAAPLVGADPAPARAATRCALAWVRFNCQPGRDGPRRRLPRQDRRPPGRSPARANRLARGLTRQVGDDPGG